MKSKTKGVVNIYGLGGVEEKVLCTLKKILPHHWLT